MSGDMPMMPSDSMNNGSMMYMNHMVMHMSFFWGKDVTVLFKGWPNGGLGMYILALAFVFFLSFTLELLPLLITPGPGPGPGPSSRAKTSPVVGGLVYTFGYAVKMALAYLVMLAVMSFNIGIFIVVVVGHAFGGFLVKYRNSLAKLGKTAAFSDEPALPTSTAPLPVV